MRFAPDLPPRFSRFVRGLFSLNKERGGDYHKIEKIFSPFPRLCCAIFSFLIKLFAIFERFLLQKLFLFGKLFTGGGHEPPPKGEVDPNKTGTGRRI